MRYITITTLTALIGQIVCNPIWLPGMRPRPTSTLEHHVTSNVTSTTSSIPSIAQRASHEASDYSCRMYRPTPEEELFVLHGNGTEDQMSATYARVRECHSVSQLKLVLPGNVEDNWDFQISGLLTESAYSCVEEAFDHNRSRSGQEGLDSRGKTPVCSY